MTQNRDMVKICHIKFLNWPKPQQRGRVVSRLFNLMCPRSLGPDLDGFTHACPDSFLFSSQTPVASGESGPSMLVQSALGSTSHVDATDLNHGGVELRESREL